MQCSPHSAIQCQPHQSIIIYHGGTIQSTPYNIYSIQRINQRLNNMHHLHNIQNNKSITKICYKSII